MPSARRSGINGTTATTGERLSFMAGRG
jgi:hypothetical protein